jgi:hypothetical protein
MSITPVQGATEFTTEMLAKNFVSIDQSFVKLEDWLLNLDKHVIEMYGRVSDLDIRLDQLTPAKKFIPKRRGRFALGVVVGVLVAPIAYRELAKRSRSASEVLKQRLKEMDAAAAKVAEKAESKSSVGPRPDLRSDV